MAEGSAHVLEQEVAAVARAELGGALAPAPGLLPGEVTEHPSPFKYVIIFLILVVVTAIEIGTSYLEGSVAAGVIVALLLFFGLVKFVLVVSYFMHLKTDQPIFRRFFTMGAIAAVVLYLIALTTLHVF
ncbi:MAG: cytochrome C oxidase subunit IV family protein [Actinomycetes bacterium]